MSGLEGVGRVRLNPADQQVAEFGDELAVTWAPSNLANQLFAATRSDVEAVTHTPVTALHPS
ncbi:dsRBD fold-containing protein [Mycobacterium sp.]|uniref:dsRBD fold-containing protein n=1 Tax=Mycobacterium sp. TaxID=1785 RepID=UPI003F96D541